MTNEQMQERVAELTDDMTEVKDDLKTVQREHQLFMEKFAIIFQALDFTAQQLSAIAVMQKRTDERHALAMAESHERMSRIEETVESISQKLDRYLAARLNGGNGAH